RRTNAATHASESPRSMRLRSLVVSAAMLTALLVVAQSFAADSTAPVLVAHLDGAVDPVTSGYLHRVVAAAQDKRAALLVITIDTPGGLDSSMRAIVQDLLSSPVPSVVFVWPAGARAASA